MIARRTALYAEPQPHLSDERSKRAAVIRAIIARRAADKPRTRVRPPNPLALLGFISLASYLAALLLYGL